MARPPLEIGTHGEINTRQRTQNGKVRHGAYTLFRDTDAVTRKVERWAATPAKAKAELRKALRDRRAGHTTTPTTFRELADVWIASVERRRAGTTADTYRAHLRRVVLPALGNLRVPWECTPARLQDFMDQLADRDQPLAPNTRRTIRTVISGCLQVAVRRGLLNHNPAGDLDAIEGKAQRAARAYSAERLVDFLAKVDADPGRGDLPDLIRFLFGTGTRIGEALAVRWRDVNLTDHPAIVDGAVIPPRCVWINGNLVYVNGKGIRRHDGKTFAANRIIELPGFVVDVLTARRPVDADELEPVFPSAVLGWRHPRNVQTAIRKLRARVGFDDFTTHVGRKTVATFLDQAGHSARQVADHLGQARVSVTQDVYLARGLANPEAAAAIDAAHQPAGG